MFSGSLLKYDAMPRFSVLLFCLFTAFIFSAFLSPDAPCEVRERSIQTVTLTLKDAVEIACKNNKPIQIQEEEVEVAKAGVLYANSEFLPKLNTQYSYTYSAASFKLPQFFEQAEGVHKDIGIFTGYQNQNTGTITVDENLFNGGASYARLKQARLNLKAAWELLRAKKLEVEFETKRLFYGLLLAYEVARIKKELVEQAQAHYSNVQNLYDHGASSRFDLLQSKVQISKVMPGYISAKNDIDILKSDLKKLLSINLKDDIKIVGKLTHDPVEIKEPEFLINAYMHNPQVIAQTLGIDVSKWGIDVARATLLPQVSGSFGYAYKSSNLNTMFNYKHSNWSGGVVVTVPIFDSFATTAKVHDARAKYAQAILSTMNLRDQIAVDVRKGCLDMIRAEAIINSQKDSIVEAAEALRIANVSYENGEAINLDILDSQVSLSQVEQNLAGGIYDYLMAQAFLDKTMGKEFLKEE